MSGYFLCRECGYYRVVDDKVVGRIACCPSCRSTGRIASGSPPPIDTAPAETAEEAWSRPAVEPYQTLEEAAPSDSQEIVDASIADDKGGGSPRWAQQAGWWIDHVCSTMKLSRLSMYVCVGSAAVLAASSALVLLLASASWGFSKSHAPDSTDELTSIDVELDGEESLPPTRLVAGKHDEWIGTGIAQDEVITGFRAVVWRNVSRHRTTKPRVRLSCGIWYAEGQSIVDALNERFGLPSSGAEWDERLYVQLDEAGLEQLIILIRSMDRVAYDEAADIDYRGVTLNFGKFRFRKLPGERIEFRTPLRGLFVWDEVDTEELLAFLMNVRDQMRKFQRRPATIQWK